VKYYFKKYPIHIIYYFRTIMGNQATSCCLAKQQSDSVLQAKIKEKKYRLSQLASAQNSVVGKKRKGSFARGNDEISAWIGDETSLPIETK
jgi:hypothetical protein